MKRSILERRTDKVMERISRIYTKIGVTNKNVYPYRKSPVDPREQIYNYLQYSPDQYMEKHGEAAIPYIERMEELKRRYQNGYWKKGRHIRKEYTSI